MDIPKIRESTSGGNSIIIEDGTIRHIVMWKVKGDTPAEREEAIQLVKVRFEGLRDRIAGLIRLEIGIDVSKVDYACDIVLVTDFENAEALAAYATDPAHLEVRDALIGVRIERHQVDYPVEA